MLARPYCCLSLQRLRQIRPAGERARPHLPTTHRPLCPHAPRAMLHTEGHSRPAEGSTRRLAALTRGRQWRVVSGWPLLLASLRPRQPDVVRCETSQHVIPLPLLVRTLRHCDQRHHRIVVLVTSKILVAHPQPHPQFALLHDSDVGHVDEQPPFALMHLYEASHPEHLRFSFVSSAARLVEIQKPRELRCQRELPHLVVNRSRRL